MDADFDAGLPRGGAPVDADQAREMSGYRRKMKIGTGSLSFQKPHLPGAGDCSL
jgi:hypothetical protein